MNYLINKDFSFEHISKSKLLKIAYIVNPTQKRMVRFGKIEKNLLEEAILKKTREKVLISIMLTDDKTMSYLNLKWRKKRKPTNILSFPTQQKFFYEKRLFLGDLAISNKKIFEEAKTKRIKPEDHFRHLLLHGTLHLIGYNHTKEGDAFIMENLEIEILKKFKIKNPYLHNL